MKAIVKSLVKRDLSDRETAVIEKRVITHLNHLKREHSNVVASLEKSKETKQYTLTLHKANESAVQNKAEETVQA
jgi:hypothetical protein